MRAASPVRVVSSSVMPYSFPCAATAVVVVSALVVGPDRVWCDIGRKRKPPAIPRTEGRQADAWRGATLLSTLSVARMAR